MMEKDYAEFLAEVEYPHGEYTNKGTILILREAYAKALVRGYEIAREELDGGVVFEENSTAKPGSPVAAAEEIFTKLSGVKTPEEAAQVLRDVVDQFKNLGK